MREESQDAVSWRLACNPNIMSTWKSADHCAVRRTITTRLALDAGSHCWGFPHGHMGCHEGPFFSSCSKIHCVEDDAKHLNRLPKALIKSP